MDTSAWIEFLRDAGSPVCEEVDLLLAGRMAICDPVRMEVLAGAKTDDHLRELRGLLAQATVLPTGPADHESAAAMYRSRRRNGETVRKPVDCLIAAIAMRHGVPILHADRDFTALARHTALALHPVSS